MPSILSVAAFLGSVSGAVLNLHQDPVPTGAHEVLVCSYDPTRVMMDNTSSSQYQEPAEYFTNEDWKNLGMGQNDADMSVEARGKYYVLDQTARLASFARIWKVIPQFFDSYFPEAKWWLEGHALLSAIRTGVTSAWTRLLSITVDSKTFDTKAAYQLLLNISRDNSDGPVYRTSGSACRTSDHTTCNVIRFPESLSSTIVFVVKMLPFDDTQYVGRFVDLQTGAFVEVTTMGFSAETGVNRDCTLDGIKLPVPKDPVKYLEQSRSDVAMKAFAGHVLFKTLRKGMTCKLYDCVEYNGWPFASNPSESPDPFNLAFAIPKRLGLQHGAWYSVPISTVNLDQCEDATSSIGNFTHMNQGGDGLPKIHVNALCRPPHGASQGGASGDAADNVSGDAPDNSPGNAPSDMPGNAPTML